jgi:rubrerythrin
MPNILVMSTLSSDPFEVLPHIEQSLPRPNSVVGYGATSEGEDSFWPLNPPSNNNIDNNNFDSTYDNTIFSGSNMTHNTEPDSNTSESSSSDDDEEENDDYFSDTYRPQRNYGFFQSAGDIFGIENREYNDQQQMPMGTNQQSTTSRSAHSRWPETPFPRVQAPVSSSSSSSTSSSSSSSSTSRPVEFDPFSGSLSTSVPTISPPPPPVDFNGIIHPSPPTPTVNEWYDVPSSDELQVPPSPPPSIPFPYDIPQVLEFPTDDQSSSENTPTPIAPRNNGFLQRMFDPLANRNIAPLDLDTSLPYSWSPETSTWVQQQPQSPPPLPPPSLSSSSSLPVSQTSEVEQLRRSLRSAQSQLIAERLNTSVLRDQISSLSQTSSAKSSDEMRRTMIQTSSSSNMTRSAAAVQEEEPSTEWTCTQCTLRNHDDLGICAACGNKKTLKSSSSNIIPLSNSGGYALISPPSDCVICMDAPRDAVIVHGSDAHHVCCMSCAKTLIRSRQSCPVCQRNIEKVLNYFS